LGRTALEVDELGFGGATISRVSEAQAAATLDAAWEAGIRYYDTAPWYGRGLSELRVGRLLREQPRSEFVISTKVGRILRAPSSGSGPFDVVFDYTYDGIQRAFEDSLQRLGLGRVDLAIVHDLDFGYHAPQARWDAMMAQLITSGWRALDDLNAADTPSLLLLQFVAGEVAETRVLLVGAYRDVDVASGDPLALTVRELARHGPTRRLHMRGLSERDVASFIELSAGTVPPAGVVDAVHAETEGNPLFIGEVVRLLADEGRL